jgi:cytochrome c1
MPSRVKAAALAGLAVALVAGGAVYALDDYHRRQRVKAEATALTGGDPERAPGLMTRYGCAGCHDIPGMRGPSGRVGPSLRRFAGRVYIGGVLANRPDNLVRWIVDPRAVSPKTAMPRTGISERDARHVAAYLLTLR